MFQGSVDMRVNCFHLLKIANDCRFNLLFGEKFQHIASAKFYHCLYALILHYHFPADKSPCSLKHTLVSYWGVNTIPKSDFQLV